MKNPVAFIIAFSYVYYMKDIPHDKKRQYESAFAKNSHGCFMFNVIFVGLFFLWFDWSGFIFIILSLAAMVLFYITEGRYSNNKKYFFRTTALFLRTYRDKEHLIVRHYNIYMACSFLVPPILFFTSLFIKSYFFGK